MRVIVTILFINFLCLFPSAQQADSNRKDTLGKIRSSVGFKTSTNKPASYKKADVDTANGKLVSNALILNANIPVSRSKIR